MSDDRLTHFELLEEFHLGEGHDQNAHGNRPVAVASAVQRKADLVAHVRALPSRTDLSSGLCRLPDGNEVAMHADECAKRKGHWTAQHTYYGWALGRAPSNEEDALHEKSETAAQETAEEGGMSSPSPAPAASPVPKPTPAPTPPPPPPSPAPTPSSGPAGLPAPGVGAPAAAPSAGAPAGGTS